MPIMNSYPKSSWLVFCYQIFANIGLRLKMCESNPAFRFIALAQSLSCVPLFLTLLTVAHQTSQSFTISWSLPKLMSV